MHSITFDSLRALASEKIIDACEPATVDAVIEFIQSKDFMSNLEFFTDVFAAQFLRIIRAGSVHQSRILLTIAQMPIVVPAHRRCYYPTMTKNDWLEICEALEGTKSTPLNNFWRRYEYDLRTGWVDFDFETAQS